MKSNKRLLLPTALLLLVSSGAIQAQSGSRYDRDVQNPLIANNTALAGQAVTRAMNAQTTASTAFGRASANTDSIGVLLSDINDLEASQQLQDDALAIERTVRNSNDQILNGMIATETTNRQSADDAQDVANAADSARQDQRITNVNNRSNAADAALNQRITNVNQRSNTADAVLQDNIDNEEAARTAADRQIVSDFNNSQRRQDRTIQQNNFGSIVRDIAIVAAGVADSRRQDGLISDNTAAIDTERNTRITNDRVLGGLIADEATTRATVDNQLASDLAREERQRKAAVSRVARESRTADRIQDRNTARVETQSIARDDALEVAIDNEATARAQADRRIARQSVRRDNQLQANINTETTNRIAADNAQDVANAADSARQDANISSNTNAIVAETANRQAADQALAGAINDEANARVAADNQLANAINSEANARANADQAIVGALNDEADTRQAADNEIKADMAVNTSNIQITAENVTMLETRLNTNFEIDLDQYQRLDILDQGVATNASAIGNLQTDVKEAKAGAALGLAAAAHHFDGRHAGLQLSISGGTFSGETATSMALGGQVNKQTFINLNMGVTSTGQIGAGAGISFKF